MLQRPVQIVYLFIVKLVWRLTLLYYLTLSRISVCMFIVHRYCPSTYLVWVSDRKVSLRLAKTLSKYNSVCYFVFAYCLHFQRVKKKRGTVQAIRTVASVMDEA